MNYDQILFWPYIFTEGRYQCIVSIDMQLGHTFGHKTSNQKCQIWPKIVKYTLLAIIFIAKIYGHVACLCKLHRKFGTSIPTFCKDLRPKYDLTKIFFVYFQKSHYKFQTTGFSLIKLKNSVLLVS